MTLFKRNRKASRVSFDDGRGQVCDRACRVERMAELNRSRVIVQASMPVIR